MKRQRRTVTLYEVRRDNITSESTTIGLRKLRTREVAKRLAAYLLRRHGVHTVLHPWKVSTTGLAARYWA